MAYTNTATKRSFRRNGASQPKTQPQIIKTWAFDSIGTHKYALQIKKASNGNPCLKIVEGVPQEDGAFRKFELTIWSEDFPKLFATLDQVRAYMIEHNIRTPDGHKYDPNWRRRRGNGERASRPAAGGRPIRPARTQAT